MNLGPTLEILERAKSLISDESNWFEIIARWYKNTTLPRRAIVELLRSNRPKDRLVVSVNNHTLDGASGVTDFRARRLTWLLPSNRLQPGKNDVVVELDKQASAPLLLEAASMEQDYHVPWQTLALT